MMRRLHHTPRLSQPRRRQCGFTLMEILVALVVLAVGLLGLAALQTSGLRNNQSAYYRSIATASAYDMADRIRANRTEHLAGTYAIDAGDEPPVGANNCGPGGAACATGAMATYDLAYWKCSLGNWNTKAMCEDTLTVQGDLPAGDGEITRVGLGTAASPFVYTITVMWDDERRGVDGTDCSGDPTVDLTCFTMSFEP